MPWLLVLGGLFVLFAAAKAAPSVSSSSTPIASMTGDDEARAANAFARLLPSLGPDVRSGRKPSIVVATLQKKFGLKPDGYLGNDTRFKLQQHGVNV